MLLQKRVEDVENDKGRTVVKVRSFVGEELVFTGTFEMYRSSNYMRKVTTYENRNEGRTKNAKAFQR